jgi:hypothetical protein
MCSRLSRSLALFVVLASLGLASCSSHGGSSHGSSSSHADKPSSHGGHPAASHASGTKKTHSGSDAAELLDLLEVGGSHDPSRFVEVEIGNFRVTHKLVAEGEPLVVKFRLFAVVSESKERRLHEALPKYEKRIRDAVISLVQKTEAEQLAEPGLKWLKAELVAAINRVVQDRALSGIAFSDFSLEEV